MTPARQPHPQPNPDMNYSALERLDIKFSELIGAIEEKQVDGQLSSKDHGDYELVCYCRGFIKAELEKERRTSHSSQPAPLNENTSIPTQNEFIAEFVGMEEKKRRERDAQVAKTAREQLLDELSQWCNDNWHGAFIVQYEKQLVEQVVDLIRLKAVIKSLRRGDP